MSEDSGRKDTLLEMGSMVEEVVMLLHDDFCSVDDSPKVARLERIVNALELKATQCRETIEAGQIDELQYLLRRLGKLVAKYYRLRR